MRIVAGQHRGRKLHSPESNMIRPTSDKVRLALFNALQSRQAIVDAIVLDAFCGTGALALEALSQGAHSAVLVDKEKVSLELAKKNAELLRESENCHFLLNDATKLLKKPDTVPPATLCFLDPPYNKDILPKALESLKTGGWLTEGCWIVAEMEKHYVLGNMAAKSEKIYGETKIIMGKLS